MPEILLHENKFVVIIMGTKVCDIKQFRINRDNRISMLILKDNETLHAFRNNYHIAMKSDGLILLRFNYLPE